MMGQVEVKKQSIVTLKMLKVLNKFDVMNYFQIKSYSSFQFTKFIHFYNIWLASLNIYKLKQISFIGLEMVYIRINQKIQSLLPKNLPKSVSLVEINNDKYLNHKDFKQVAKKLKLQLHKYIHRKDIIPESQMHHMIELSKRTALQKQVIQQLKARQQYKKKKPSLSDQISFMCKEAIYQSESENISDQVYSASKVLFGMCMSSILGYLAAENYFGLDFFYSLCVGGLSAGGVLLWNRCRMKTCEGYTREHQKQYMKKSKRVKGSEATIEFGREINNSTSIATKGKVKKV